MRQIESEASSIPLAAAWLGGFGLLPFALGAVMANIGVTADFGFWFITGYGAIILSFLGGIQWGVGLHAREARTVAFVISILISLVGWAATFFAPPLSLIVLAGGFVAALVFDAIAVMMFGLPGWFLKLRVLLSMGVLASLALAAIPVMN